MRYVISFACAEFLLNTMYKFCLSNEGGSHGAQADLTLTVAEDDLELGILLPLSLSAGCKCVLPWSFVCVFVFETGSHNAVLAGVDPGK